VGTKIFVSSYDRQTVSYFFIFDNGFQRNSIEKRKARSTSDMPGQKSDITWAEELIVLAITMKLFTRLLLAV